MMNKLDRHANIVIIKDALAIEDQPGRQLEEWHAKSARAATGSILDDYEQMIKDLQELREELRGKLSWAATEPVNDFYERYDLD